MKTIFIKENKRPVIADIDNNDVDVLDRRSTYSLGIDELYLAPEDCEIKITHNGITTIKKAQKGDLIVKFYASKNYPELVAVVKNADIKKNVVAILAKEAADQASAEIKAVYSDLRPCCDECSTGM